MIPCKTVAVTAILAERLRFNLHTRGIGMMSMTAPVMTFGIAMYLANATSSIHFPPRMDLFHS